jgi:hypothetical protein
MFGRSRRRRPSIRITEAGRCHRLAVLAQTDNDHAADHAVASHERGYSRACRGVGDMGEDHAAPSTPEPAFGIHLDLISVEQVGEHIGLAPHVAHEFLVAEVQKRAAAFGH